MNNFRKENINIKKITDFKLLPISTCNEYEKYKSIIDGELFNISNYNNDLFSIIKKKKGERQKRNFRFNNLTNNSRLKFINWLNNLEVNNLHKSHVKEIIEFIDLSMNISNDIIVITQNEIVIYAVLGDVSNNLLNIKSIFNNYGLSNNNYTFTDIKPELIEYLNNCTSNIKDINLDYISKSSYKRYLLTT